MSETSKARAFLIGLTGCAYAIVPILAWLVGLSVDPRGFTQLSAGAMIFLLGFGLLCHWRGIPSLLCIVECTGMGLLLTSPLVVSTYIAFALKLPLQDQQLLQLDRLLGIDWLSLIAFFDAHPLLAKSLMTAYQTFHYQLLFLPVVLSLCGHRSRAYQVVGTYGLICVIASIITIWYPALGTYTDFSLRPGDLKNINGILGVEYVPQIVAVRNDPNFVLQLEHASGIISFPSVHAAVAVLCSWGAWTIRWIRFPMIFLNVLMLLAAITEGGHYVVDLVAGIGVAGFSMASVLYISRSGNVQFYRSQSQRNAQQI
ncbi:phosphatase PAP2 family protein [Rhizobium laguerreae]|uniref:phosphatase PAP2 family protein n=1 Tax=Rhizobium laguerreae TaxID=1076926 RepID=UPI001C918AF5|nr:phosphatase PAP2 family protein [Rhizobium laguerreae]MBY3074732.1 phosphatase PAP2 family protein [Rhizobium laguerreae]MBY3141539.1 phosphatase PAP2 family protein [Rhizobium laguerreae]MBY3265812.1 phosphatase PAP2 family protein [Rhizobium laguerreae]MBY3340886.1 phosphatase PAP2 family protein [Rhizobium laguerreae]MBY3494936.1 phosphatase PAP2 family protein [Rhizobium laguerreae]